MKFLSLTASARNRVFGSRAAEVFHGITVACSGYVPCAEVLCPRQALDVLGAARRHRALQLAIPLEHRLVLIGQRQSNTVGHWSAEALCTNQLLPRRAGQAMTSLPYLLYCGPVLRIDARLLRELRRAALEVQAGERVAAVTPGPRGLGPGQLGRECRLVRPQAIPRVIQNNADQSGSSCLMLQ
jgi:hypothetical protein